MWKVLKETFPVLCKIFRKVSQISRKCVKNLDKLRKSKQEFFFFLKNLVTFEDFCEEFLDKLWIKLRRRNHIYGNLIKASVWLKFGEKIWENFEELEVFLVMDFRHLDSSHFSSSRYTNANFVMKYWCNKFLFPLDTRCKWEEDIHGVGYTCEWEVRNFWREENFKWAPLLPW